MKKPIAIFIILLLSACASGPKQVWSHASSNRNYYEDKLGCKKLSISFYSTKPDTSFTPHYDPYLNPLSTQALVSQVIASLDITDKINKNKKEAEIYNDCLKAQGWYLTVEKTAKN